MMNFITYAIGLAFLLVFIWELFRAFKDENSSKKEASLKEQLKDARMQNKDLEYMVYSLEHQKDMLNIELENQRQLCDIYEETADIYKKRVVFLEKMIEKGE